MGRSAYRAAESERQAAESSHQSLLSSRRQGNELRLHRIPFKDQSEIQGADWPERITRMASGNAGRTKIRYGRQSEQRSRRKRIRGTSICDAKPIALWSGPESGRQVRESHT